MTQDSAIETRTSGASAPVEISTLKRLLFTLVALVIYRLGLQIPGTGLNPDSIPGLPRWYPGLSPAEHAYLSVFALGVGPIFSILVAAEVLKLAAPSLAAWANASPRNRSTWNRYVLLAGLILTATQAIGMAVGLENSHGSSSPIVPDPGLAFEAQFVLTIVAGTAFLAWLADQITRHGIGSGFWVLLLVPAVADFIKLPKDISNLKSVHQIATEGIWAFAALIFAATALIILLLKAKIRTPLTGKIVNAGPSDDHGAPASILLWPSNVALTISGIISAFIYSFEQWRGSAQPQEHIFKVGTAASIVLTSMLIFAVTKMWASSRQQKLSPIQILLTAALAIVISLAMDIINWHYLLPFIDGGWFIAIAVVAALALPENLSAFFERYFPPAPGLPPKAVE